ncbi:CheY-like chemotaxis protein [Bradyrhizobium sp. LB7.2]
MSVAFAGNSTTGSSREAGPLRVMIVDDSVVIRGLISRWIGAEHDMEVAASLRTGLEAVNQIERINTLMLPCSTSKCPSWTASRRCRNCWRRSAISSSSWPRR